MKTYLRPEIEQTLQAIEQFVYDPERLPQFDNDDVGILARLGAAYRALGMPVAAERAFDASQATEQSGAQFAHLAALLFANGRENDATVMIDRRLAIAETLGDDEKTIALVEIAHAYFFSRLFEDALSVAKQIPDRDRRNRQLLLIVQFVAEDDIEKANRIVSEDSLGAPGKLRLAMGLAEVSRYEEAQAIVREAMAEVGDFTNLGDWGSMGSRVAEAFSACGDIALAQEIVDDLRNAGLDNTAQEGVDGEAARYYTRTGQFDQALASAQRRGDLFEPLGIYAMGNVAVEWAKAGQSDAAYEVLTQLKSRMESPDIAARYLATLIARFPTIGANSARCEDLKTRVEAQVRDLRNSSLPASWFANAGFPDDAITEWRSLYGSSPADTNSCQWMSVVLTAIAEQGAAGLAYTDSIV